MSFLSSNGFTILSFLFFTGLVAFISWWKTRGDNLSTESGFYLAGRGLTFTVICGSLVMTDLSAEQLVGNNGQSVYVGMGTFAQQGLAWVGLVVAGLFFIPVFLKLGVTTIPEFYESRYDKATRRIISVLFLLSYIFIMLPTILYAGAQVFVNFFGLDEILGIPYFWAIALVCVVISIVGSIYAIAGGLKAIAVSDMLNGIGMFVCGLIIPVLGMVFLSNALGGDGSVLDGLDKFLHTDPAMMNAWNEWDSAEPWVPWPMMFLGLSIQTIYFWGTNQSIVQRAFGAKNCAESQKGMLFAGLVDIFTPLFLVVPGVIAALAYSGTDWGSGDTVFSTLMNEVLPTPLLGFFAACIFGAILSSYNSVLNSASTLYALDVYRDLINPDVSDTEVVKRGQRFGTIITIFATVISPFIMYAGGVTTFLNTALSIFSTPVLVALLFGVFNKRTPRNAAKIVIPIHIVLYVLWNYVLRALIPAIANVHYWYSTTILFVLDVLLFFILTKLHPLQEDYVFETHIEKGYDLRPWKYRYHLTAVIIAVTVAFYIAFSPLGFGKSDETTWERYQTSISQSAEE